MALDREQVGLLFKLRADSSEAQRSLTQFRGTVNNAVGDIRGKFDGLANSITGFSSSLSGGFGGLAGSLTGVAGLAAGAAAGLGALALQTANYAGQIADLAAKTNLSTDTLQSLKLAATLTGQSFESVSETAVIFQRRMEEAKNGNDRLKATFDALQINLDGPVDDAFRQTLERLSGVEDGSQKTAAAVDLFGRSGASLLPIMGQVGGSFQGLEDRARELGIVLSEDAIAKADEFGDQIDILKLQLGGLANDIGSIVIPAFSDFIGSISGTITIFRRLSETTEDSITKFQRLLFIIGSFSNLRTIPQGIFATLTAPGFLNRGTGFEGPDIDPDTGLPTRRYKLKTDDGTKGGKAKKEKLPNLPIRDFSNIVEQYFKQLGQLEDEQIKRLDQAQARSIRVQEEILQAAQDREIAALQDQIDRRVITEEEGAARIAAVRVAAFARYEDQINRQIAELDEQITAAAAAAQARPFDNILQARLRALQAERELVRSQLTLIQDERTASEEEGNRAIAAARDRDTEDFIDYLNNLERLEEESKERRKQRLLSDPSSSLSIFGEAGQEAADKGIGMFGQLASSANEALASVSNSMGNMQQMFTGAFSTIGSGLGSMIEAFILTGELGPQAFRKLAAGVLASLAAQAAVKAVFELAEGLAAAARYDYVSAGQHFAAAKTFGLVALVAGIAGKAIAPGGSGAAGGAGNFTQGGQSQNNGRRVIEQGDRQRPEPQIIIIRAETEPGVVVRKVVEDYRGNGESRKLLRRDMLGEGG